MRSDWNIFCRSGGGGIARVVLRIKHPLRVEDTCPGLRVHVGGKVPEAAVLRHRANVDRKHVGFGPRDHVGKQLPCSFPSLPQHPRRTVPWQARA